MPGRRLLPLVTSLLALAGAFGVARADEGVVPVDTVAVVRVPLAGPWSVAEAEVSGLSWAPGPDGTPVLLWLAEELLDVEGGLRTPLAYTPRADVVAATARAVHGEDGPALTPRAVRWVLPPELAAREGRTAEAGFEAVAVRGDRIAVAREQGGEDGGTLLLEGRLCVLDGSYTAVFDTARDVPAPALRPGLAPDDVRDVRHNKSYEALVACPGGWLLLHECGGARFVPSRVGEARAVPMAPFPYRLADASARTGDGRFLAISYHFRGRECLPDPQELARDQRRGGTPPGGEHIERLVELVYDAGGVHRTATPPTWLRLEAEARNWEGLVRIDAHGQGLAGALLVTDRWPLAAKGTLFAYVATPAAATDRYEEEPTPTRRRRARPR